MDDATIKLKSAVELDIAKRFTESLVMYRQGILLLINYMKGLKDASKKKYFTSKIEGYMQRAEQIKKFVIDEKEKGTYKETITLEDNSTGNGFKSLLGRFVEHGVNQVYVQDPNLNSETELFNFLGFCEFIVKNCRCLETFELATSFDDNNADKIQAIKSIRHALTERNVKFTVNYSQNITENEIRFNNGWTIKIDRGFDFIKPCSGIIVGKHNLEFRFCHKTVVHINFNNSD